MGMFGRSAKNFAKDTRATTAIEYAILAPIFFTIIFIGMEFSVLVFKRNHLKHVMYEASRILQTGQIQNAANPKFEFEREICAEALHLFNCADVFYDVRSFDQITQVTFPAPTLDANLKPTNFQFQPGGPSRVTAMRLAGRFYFATPYMDRIFGLGGKPMFVVGHSIARNEPYVCTKAKCE